MPVDSTVPPSGSGCHDLKSPATAILFANDGRHAAVLTGDDRMWVEDVQIHPTQVPAHARKVATACFVQSKPVNVMVAVSDGGLFEFTFYNPAPRLIGKLPAGAQWTFSPDGQKLAGEVSGELVLFNVSDASEGAKRPMSDALAQLVYARGGSLLVGLSKGGALLAWHAGTLEKLLDVKLGNARQAAVSADGQSIAVTLADDKLAVLDAGSGRTRNIIPCIGARELACLGLTDDGKHAIAVGPAQIDGKTLQVVRVFDLVTGAEYVPLQAHDGQVTAAALGDPWLVTAGRDGTLRSWEWDLTLDHLRFRKGIQGDLAEGYARALEALVARDKNGLRMTDIWDFDGGDFSKQYEFELPEGERKVWYSVLAGMTPPRNFVLTPHEAGKLYDVCGLWCAKGVVVSQKVVDVLKSRGVTGWAVFPVALNLPDNEQPPCPYYGLVATATIGPLHRQFQESTIDMREYVDVANWDGSDIFRPERHWCIYMTSRVLDILSEEGVTGWEATGLSLSDRFSDRETREAPLPKKAKKLPVSATAEPVPPKLAKSDAISLSDVERMIEEHELTKWSKHITAALRRSIRFNLESAKKGALAIGATRLGGEPDLPADVAWPMHQQKPQMFLGQLRLSDLKPLDLDDVLPASGLLSFFMLPEGAGRSSWMMLEDSGWAVVYTHANVPLVHRRLPGEVPSTQELDPHGLIIAPTLTLPPGECWQLDSWGLDEDAYDAYGDLREELEQVQWHKGPSHRILGWPAPQIQGDVFHEIAKGAAKVSGPEEPCDWLMLLQLDSDPKLGMQWGDAGASYLGIPSADLAKRDFSRVWCVTQCG